MLFAPIQMPLSPGESFQKGFNYNDNLMKQILERNQLKQKAEQEKANQEQLERHFQANFGLSKAAAGRAAQAAADAHRKAMNDLDPTFQAKQYEALENYYKNKVQSQNNANQISMPTDEFGQGQGVFSQPGLEEAQQQGQEQQPVSHLPGGVTNQDLEMMKQFPPLRGMYKKIWGIDPLVPIPQTPEQKQADKIKLEDYKAEHKKALEEEKANLKNKALQQKTIEAAKNDLPHLESTLDALKKMKKIAKNNPDLFGHSGFLGVGAEGAAERFAKTTNNPNAGSWQTLGLGPIIAAESKMSSKGNQLALKQALANKPNFSENQKVAIAKIDANINQIEKSIQENKKLTGVEDEGNFAFMIDPSDGQAYKVPIEDVAKRTAEKWTHVK